MMGEACRWKETLLISNGGILMVLKKHKYSRKGVSPVVVDESGVEGVVIGEKGRQAGPQAYRVHLAGL